MAANVRTNRAEIKKVWYALADNSLRGEWADSLLRILTAVMNGGSSEPVTLMLHPEELKVWHEYAAKALL